MASERVLVGNEAARYLSSLLRRFANDGLETTLRVGLMKIADEMESKAVGSDEQAAYQAGQAAERERVVAEIEDRIPKARRDRTSGGMELESLREWVATMADPDTTAAARGTTP